MYYVRHGQSLRNQIKESYILQNKDLNQYNNGKYSDLYFDCQLSNTGIQQCINLSEKTKTIHFQAVLVSPLKRALKTCDLIVKKLNQQHLPQVIVEPLLTQILNSATNFGTDLENSMMKFTNFDFDQVKQNPSNWYIHILKQQKKDKIIKKVQKNKSKSSKKIAKAILSQFIENPNILEQKSDIKQRSQKLEEKLKEYRLKYKGNILIVGHSRIMKQLCQMKGQCNIPNGELMYYDIQNKSITLSQSQ